MLHQPLSICSGVYRAAHVTQILPIDWSLPLWIINEFYNTSMVDVLNQGLDRLTPDGGQRETSVLNHWNTQAMHWLCELLYLSFRLNQPAFGESMTECILLLFFR